MFFRLCRAEIASAVPGCSAENIITQRKFLRKFSEGRRMPRKRNFLKIFISFLKNRRKWGVSSSVRFADSFPKEEAKEDGCLFV